MHRFPPPHLLALFLAATAFPSAAQEVGRPTDLTATTAASSVISGPAPKSAAATPSAPESGTKPEAPASTGTPTKPEGASKSGSTEGTAPVKPVVKPAAATKSAAAVSTISPEEIEGFDSYPAALQTIIKEALALTRMNLRYQFGSADPSSGGMDCSGAIYHLLRKAGIKDIPRQSDEVCHWLMLHSMIYRTENVETLKDRAFSALKPGDLLFWTGTYETASPREIPVTHVMMYLGKRKKGGLPVIFGASEGRSYEGQRRNGVSVFDFPLPRPGQKSDFYGYGPLPLISWEQVRKAEPSTASGE